MTEGLWWVMAREEPYKFWKGETVSSEPEVLQVGDRLVDPNTGEVLSDLVGPEPSCN